VRLRLKTRGKRKCKRNTRRSATALHAGTDTGGACVGGGDITVGAGVRQRYKYDSTSTGGGARALYAEYERSSVTDGSRDTFVIISIKHVKVYWE
jgi:hypothetical protein